LFEGSKPDKVVELWKISISFFLPLEFKKWSRNIEMLLQKLFSIDSCCSSTSNVLTCHKEWNLTTLSLSKIIRWHSIWGYGVCILFSFHRAHPAVIEPCQSILKHLDRCSKWR
jgi:hypothetical protein